MISLGKILSKKRIIVYGDLHGCLNRFKALREKIGIRAGDEEICAGDVIGKGKHWSSLIAFLQDQGIRSVIGNHEANALRLLQKPDLTKDEKEEIKNLSKKDLPFLRSLPPFIKINNLLIVHGGVHSGLDLGNLSAEDIATIYSMRYVCKDNPAKLTAKQAKDAVLWQETYGGELGFVIYGHQRSKEVIKNKHSLGIDTGCVHGGKLTAAVVTNTKKIEYEIVDL
ncbi:MAG: metallophosphoesterase [Helicobacteraceae bacterium]